MVIGSLSYAERYHSLHSKFKKAFEFLRENGLSLGEGKHTIEENELYLILSRGLLRAQNDAPLEAHNKYIDIQVILEGEEKLGVRDRDRCYSSRGGYDEVNDIEFFNDSYHNIISLSKDDFAIFFPEDAHAPLIGKGEVVKAILKVRI